MRKSVVFRSFILICIMLVSAVAIFAQEVDITWNWTATQDGITAFRYQMDGELDGAWTVVDAAVTSYETGPVDATVPHVLYVQQSFDGVNWSASGSTAFDPVAYAASIAEPAAEEVIAEAPAEVVAVVAEVPVETPAEVVAVVAEAPVEAPVEVAVTPTEISVASSPTITTAPAPEPIPVPVVSENLNETRMGIELSGGFGGIASNIVLSSLFDTANTYYNMQTKILPVAAFDFVADNLKPIGEKMGIGLRAGVGYQLYAPDSNKINFADIHVLGKLDISLGRKLAMEVGVGATLVVPYADLNANSVLAFNTADINLFYGPVGQLNARYNFSNSLSLIMQIEGRLLFSGTLDLYEITGLARVGVGYRF
ncbi:MAG: hypothetical protein CVV52_02925 [Spirochaetae bacterium HGW-Spirochaetae-8]|nr:MAG: hypothetical protein CVV52_02925 [Spirochaetae bacterium HGW-Spirochaetae-8]